jgi:hypothetical protein
MHRALGLAASLDPAAVAREMTHTYAASRSASARVVRDKVIKLYIVLNMALNYRCYACMHGVLLIHFPTSIAHTIKSISCYRAEQVNCAESRYVVFSIVYSLLLHPGRHACNDSLVHTHLYTSTCMSSQELKLLVPVSFPTKFN